MAVAESFVREVAEVSARLAALVARHTGGKPEDGASGSEPGAFSPVLLISLVNSNMQAAGLACFLWEKDVVHVPRHGVTWLRIASAALIHRTRQILIHNDLTLPKSKGAPLTGFLQDGQLKLAHIIEYQHDDKGGWYFCDQRWLPAFRGLLQARKIELPR
jgi:hypothetical protein